MVVAGGSSTYPSIQGEEELEVAVVEEIVVDVVEAAEHQSKFTGKLL